MKLENCNLSANQKLVYQKKLSEYKEKNENYKQLLKKAIKELKKINVDINDLSLKQNQNGKLLFDFSPAHFSFQKPENKIPIPLNSNKQTIDFWSAFLKCKKIPIKSKIYAPNCPEELNGYITTKGNEICALWLVGKINNKHYEFAFSIAKPIKNNENLTNFTIAMSVLVSKEQNLWVELARFDSKGPIHFNYTDINGNFYEDVNELELSSPPHLHINSDKSEVLTYSPYAHQTYKTISNKIQNEDKTAFHDAIIEMIKFCNINNKIFNPFITEDYNFHIGYNLFDEFIVPRTVDEFDFLFNYYNNQNTSPEKE